MKASELRVGNWLYSQSRQMPFQIWATTIVQVENGEANALEPIPLTKEWLLKFGFKIDDGVGFWFGHGIALGATHGNGVFFIYDQPNKSVHCKYVHQLQNLYFVLTGKELTTSDSASPADN